MWEIAAILLAMPDDPAQYWQDLTANYRQMSDGELLELAAKPDELTDVAQQVLRDEMKLRKLTATTQEPAAPASAKRHADIRWEPRSYRYEFAHDESEEAEGPREYTWKTKLCDCETRVQAKQLAYALQLAGIDSYIQVSRTTSGPFDLTYPRIFVAADQLEQAQAVAAQPIPQDIIDDVLEEEESEPQDFEAPRCPKCGAPDPILEGADSVNSWSCETCGAEWTDSEPTTSEGASEEKSPAS